MAENYSFRSSMNGFNRNDVMAYIETLLEEKAALEIRVSALEEEKKSLSGEIEELRLKAEADSQKAKSTDDCDECEIKKVYEARLGAAMLDAKRFSEILVKEANDKASGLFSDAYASAEDTSVRAKKIALNIIDINKQFNAAFKVLLDNMNGLGDSLEKFKGEVKNSGKAFVYKTDFSSDDDGDNQRIKLHSESSSVTSVDVNFDDADEFDIRVDLND